MLKHWNTEEGYVQNVCNEYITTGQFPTHNVEVTAYTHLQQRENNISELTNLRQVGCHCARSRKVASSILYEANEFFFN
jgi:hypothetical protein